MFIGTQVMYPALLVPTDVCGLLISVFHKATDHLKTLSAAERTDVAEGEADFNQNYGRAGLKLAHANV